MDTLGPDYGQVHFIVDRGAERGRTVYLHRGQLLDDDVVEVGSFRVTSMARTVADVACAADFAGALTVVDCGLRRGVPRAQLEGLAAGLAGSSGIANFRNALGHAHEKAETAGESLSRARMIEMGDIPLPRLQHQFFSPAGSFLARSDFDWDGKVIGEFDGRGKYTADGQEAGASWHAERERHNRLLQHRQVCHHTQALQCLPTNTNPAFVSSGVDWVSSGYRTGRWWDLPRWCDLPRWWDLPQHRHGSESRGRASACTAR